MPQLLNGQITLVPLTRALLHPKAEFQFMMLLEKTSKGAGEHMDSGTESSVKYTLLMTLNFHGGVFLLLFRVALF
jgi:hypothetical protein